MVEHLQCLARKITACITIVITVSSYNMMMSSNENIFRVTGHLCREFTGPRWIPRKRPVTRSFDVWALIIPLHWRHNGHGSLSNHQRLDCLLNRLFRHISKKTSNLRVTGLCEGDSPVTSEFPAQMASNAEDVSIWWRHRTRGWGYSANSLRCVIFLILQHCENTR